MSSRMGYSILADVDSTSNLLIFRVVRVGWHLLEVLKTCLFSEIIDTFENTKKEKSKSPITKRILNPCSREFNYPLQNTRDTKSVHNYILLDIQI